MKKVLANPKLLCAKLVAGLASAVAPHSLSAQGVNDIVRNLNAVINPIDAQHLEDQARGNNQPAEERYWRIIARASKLTIGAGILTPAVTMAIVASTLTTRTVSALMPR
jgi:hypothetical protein